MVEGISKTRDRKNDVNAASIAASIGGLAVGTYAGINILFPLLGVGAFWLLGRKLLRPADPAYLQALSIQGGHMLWLALGSIILGSWSATLGDLVVLAVGLLWLWVRPGAWPLAILGLYQAGSLAVNAFAIVHQPFGSLPHKALVVHIALRCAALFCMWHAFRMSRNAAPTDA